MSHSVIDSDIGLYFCLTVELVIMCLSVCLFCSCLSPRPDFKLSVGWEPVCCAHLCICSTWHKSLALRMWSICTYQLNKHMTVPQGDAVWKVMDNVTNQYGIRIQHQQALYSLPHRCQEELIQHWVWAWWAHTACSELFLSLLLAHSSHAGEEKARKSTQYLTRVPKGLPRITWFFPAP